MRKYFCSSFISQRGGSGAPIVAMLSGAAEPCPTRLGFPIWLEGAERGRNYPVFSTTLNAPWHFALRSGTLNTVAVRLPCVLSRMENCNTLYLLLRRNHGEAFCRTTGSRRFERHRVGQVVFLLLHCADKFPPLAVWHSPEGPTRSRVPSMRPLGLRLSPT